ncbi:MAG TPA: HAMP domain-containing sensor histidine kinase [Candidatus Eisenbacteria bacterium]
MVETPPRRWPFFAISVLGLAVGLWAVLLRARLEPELPRLHLGIVLVHGLILLGVNSLVLAPRVDRGPLRDLYWCTLLYGVATMIDGPAFPRFQTWTGWVLPAIWIVCLTLLPVTFFRMAQAFPRPRKLLDRQPGLMRGLWIAVAALILWQGAAYLRFFLNPSPAAWEGTLLPRTLAQTFLVLAVGLGCVTLYRSGRKLELSRDREQIKWVLWGFAIGVAPFVFLRTLPRLAGFASPVPPEADRVFELAIPMALTFAVVRPRFLDIDIIIRRSLIYGILAGALAAIYVLVGVLAAPWITTHAPRYTWAVRVLAVALPVILYTPFRRWIEIWVDRTFFKVQHDYAQALLAFQDAARGASSQDEIAALCRGFLEDQLLPRRVAALMRKGRSFTTAGEIEDSDAEALLDATAAYGTSRRLIAAPNSTSRPDLESAEFPEPLAREEFRLALPISSDGRSLGVIFVGKKRSEQRFIEEDLKLLYAVRAEAAAALERVELVQRALEDALGHEKAEELERLKSEFYSRVAHDLRAPLTSIRSAVQNLLDGVRGSSSEHIPQLQMVESAANQLGRLVNDLLDLSRLEHPSARAAHGPVDLLPLVQEAIAKVQPAARARNIRFELSVAPSLKPVRGDRVKLLEVVTNLLENAARYSPDGQAVDIALDRNGEGQMLVVRDRGPGLSANECERIFERFEQGRPSPYSKEPGFGLGLYVARSYLELMCGTIEGGNHPEGGARFVCTVPEWKETHAIVP